MTQIAQSLSDLVGTLQNSTVWRLPPDPLEWASKRLRFNAGVESAPSYILDKSPYHQPILSWWTDRHVEEILLHGAAQIGKSVLMNLLVAYIIENDPGPLMFVEPDEDLTKEFIKRRLRPALKATFPDRISDSQRDSEWTEKGGIVGGTLIVPTWASSEKKLRSWPIRYVFGDELSAWKFNRQAVWDRTAQFPANRKALWATTPTLEDEQSWNLRTNVFQRWSWAVPCPHCRQFIVLDFKNVKWDGCKRADGSYDLERVEKETVYACQECGGIIEQTQRPEMLRNGKAICETPERPHRQVALRVTALDVPARPWGVTARTFLQCKNNPADLQIFVNQQLCEPWVEKREGLKVQELKARQMDIAAGVCPENTRVLLASADVQRGHLYLVVRARLDDGRSILVHCEHIDGRTEKISGNDEPRVKSALKDALKSMWETIMCRAWKWAEHAECLLPTLLVLDAGDGVVKDLVYAFAAQHRGRVVPIKGEGDDMKKLMAWSDIDKFPGLKLGIVNTSHYRDVVLESYRQSLDDAGAWLLNNEAPDEYYEQMLSWQTVEIDVKDRQGRYKRTKREWRPIHGRQDHYLDAEIYWAAVEDNKTGLRRMTVDAEAGQSVTVESRPKVKYGIIGRVGI